MLNSPDNPLKVALLTISPHNQAILEFFFAGAGKKIFRTVRPEQAEALIVDFDHPGAYQEWQTTVAATPKPAIVLSVKETTEANTVWVPKPLTSKSLAGAAQQVRALLPDSAAAHAETALATTEARRQDAERDIASLRALLDEQRSDTQPFGVPNEQQRKKSTPKTNTRQPRNAALFRAEPDPAADDPTAQTQRPAAKAKNAHIPAPTTNEVERSDQRAPEKKQEEQEARVSEAAQHEQEQRWALLCGTHNERLNQNNWQQSTLIYTPENYLLNSVVDALKLARQSGQHVQLKIDHDDYIFLMPDVSLAYSSIDLYADKFVHLCETPQQGRMQLHLPSTSELAALQETLQRDAQHTYDLEALIWTVSLLTSHGRLSHNADFSQSLVLKHWPNLTRLEHFPHVIRIAALWQERPANPFEIADWLSIPQRYTIAFYNAAHTLGLLGFVEKQQMPLHSNKPATKKNRGLFSKLLKRLLGEGKK